MDYKYWITVLACQAGYALYYGIVRNIRYNKHKHFSFPMWCVILSFIVGFIPAINGGYLLFLLFNLVYMMVFKEGHSMCSDETDTRYFGLHPRDNFGVFIKKMADFLNIRL